MSSTNPGRRPHLTNHERVPRSYKEVEKVLNEVKACKGSVKTVLNSSRLRGGVFKKVYSLAVNVLKHRYLLEKIIEETKLLEKETFLRKELAGILIYELIFSKGLPGESKPVLTIKKYEKEIDEVYQNAIKDGSFSLTEFPSLPRYARVNTLLTSVSDVMEDLKDCGFQQIGFDESISQNEFLDLIRNLQVGCFLVDYHFKDLLVFANDENLTGWHLYQKGHIFIQDKSSYIPVYALDPKPGCTVLDACAAPGMKTVHIAAAMENKGEIYAYERNEERFETLKGTLELANVKITEADCEDFYLVNANDPKFRSLEYILVDPSCSGSGMVSRMDNVTDTEDSKNKFRLQKLAGFQILLLKHALSFPYVKRVVYSTCSITEEENEYVVHEVLNKFINSFKLVSVMPDWPIRGSDSFEFGHLCLRAYPERSLTNGFFVAMFERIEFGEEQYTNSCSLDDSSISNPHKLMKMKSKKKKGKSKLNNYDKFECMNSETVAEDHFDKSWIKVEQKLHASEVEEYTENNFESIGKFGIKDEKKNRKKHHSENQDMAEVNFRYVSKPSVDLDTGEIGEAAVKEKKHKKKKHSEIREAIQLDVTETSNDLQDSTVTKKHKKKRHSKSLEKLGSNVTEVTNDSKDNTITKKHKKRKHGKSGEEIKSDVTEVANDSIVTKNHKKKRHSENLVTIESIVTETKNESIDNTIFIKHKKKKLSEKLQTEDLEKSDYKVILPTNLTKISFENCVSSSSNSNSEVLNENKTESNLQLEETQLKKSHKKKCKYKKNKDEC